MGFNRCTPPVTSLGGTYGTGAKASVRVTKQGDPHVLLTIHERIYSQLPSEHKKWTVLEGDGEDTGYLRMSPAEDGEFLPTVTKKGKSLMFRLGELDCAPLTKQLGKWCGVKVEGGAIVVKLPSWAFPKKDNPDGRLPRVVTTKPQPATVNMGEPTPDFHRRRAEAEKATRIAGTELKQSPSSRKARDFSNFK